MDDEEDGDDVTMMRYQERMMTNREGCTVEGGAAAAKEDDAGIKVHWEERGTQLMEDGDSDKVRERRRVHEKHIPQLVDLVEWEDVRKERQEPRDRVQVRLKAHLGQVRR